MSWMDHEPVRGGYPDLRMVGLPGLERMTRTDIFVPPPIHHLFGLEPVETAPGFSTFRMPASPWLQSPAGVFLGGVAALVADAPLGTAVLSRVEPGVFGVTSELSMSFLRPAEPSLGMLYGQAQLIDVGRSVGLSQATVEDPNGNLLAHLTSRYFLRRIDPPPDTSSLVPTSHPAQATPDPYLRPAPEIDPSAWIGMSGLECFQRGMKGELEAAPFAQLFGMETVDVSEGMIVHRVRATEWFCSPARTIYGGFLAFFADAAITGAVTTTVPAGSSCASLDLHAHFLRPGLADGRELMARAHVVHRGQSLAVAHAEILNADGKKVLTASGSAMILQGRPWARVSPADEAPPDEN
ncbi:MAG: PaaI family thioesterase [Actinobacteria bacterium]|nr:PaaI family thioesterase [Actinomycetota bacterium]